MSRLLIVEDDGIQQAVLKSVLEKRGYETEVASDGLTAVRMLRGGGFDLALLDYHLPEIDGFASARLLHDLMNDDDRPKLIAVTAASDSLNTLARSEHVFDAIVAKPLDLPALLSVVEAQLHATSAGQATRAAEATWRALGLLGAPSVLVLPHPSPAQAQLLRCYFDLTGLRAPEAVLLLGPEGARDAVTARSVSAHFSLPFVNLTGPDPDADATFSAADPATWGAVAAAIARFRDQRAMVAPSVPRAADLDTRLLAYLFLSGKPLEPSLGFTTQDCARYPGYFPQGAVRLAAERLADRGLLARRFFDRFHTCRGCGSSRLNVREECVACGSAQLRDVPLLHHFRCAHQAPEADFVRGHDLVCPKCRQHLRHYGSDYDKPGTATACGGCGALTPEPTVGFVCLDCGSRTEGDAASKRDVFTYALTSEGIAALRRGTARVLDDPAGPAESLPNDIQAALARSGPGAVLIELRYGARQRIEARRGESGFAAMRRLFLDNLLSAFLSASVIPAGTDADHVLIRNASPADLAALSPALLDSCQDVLAEGLEPTLRILTGPLAPVRH